VRALSPAEGVSDGKVQMATRLYVGNLPFSATEDEVRRLFEGSGTVVSVDLINDRETGRPRGFGFVEMSTAEEAAAAAKALDGSNMGSRQLRVNEAQARQRGGRSGGGYGGRGGSPYRDGGGRRRDF
jgi:cold-inducible RNA-binding protein